MKNKLFGIFGKSARPTLATMAVGALLAFSSPVAALAEGHGGGRGFSGGAHGFSGGRGFSEGGRAYYGGHDYGRGYGGGYYRGGVHYGGGLYLGFGAPYGYGPAYGYAPVPAPCGYYDRAGYWHAAPGCINGGLGY